MTANEGRKDAAAVEPAALARRLLRECRSGALGTLMAGSGAPYCSLVNVATAADGSPLLLISTLALHTRNLQADARVCLLVEQRSGGVTPGGDPLQGARLMLSGEARPDTEAASRRRYLARHPEAAQFAGFGDFAITRIVPTGAHLVAGFGRIADLEPAAILTDLTDAQALVEAEPDICAHMNDHHAEALRLYATRLAGAPDGAWRCIGCDPEGLDLQCAGVWRRVEFPHRVTTPVALRQMLRELAETARAQVPH